jgi:hypothetical protein
MSIGLILLIIAFILFLLSAFGVPRGGTTVNLQSLGLACVVLAMLIGGADLAV